MIGEPSNEPLPYVEPTVVYQPSLAVVLTTGWRPGPSYGMREFTIHLNGRYVISERELDHMDRDLVFDVAEDMLRRRLIAQLQGPLDLSVKDLHR